MQSKKRDTDEKQLRKKNFRLRFKKLVLTVMLNQQWMDEPEEQGIVMNAKKNVAFLIRQKRKTGVLTVAVNMFGLRYLRYSFYDIPFTIFDLRYSFYDI